MKFSKNIEACTLSPIRKFYPYVVAAEAQGRTVHHLNIGQPDIQTPRAFFDAVHNFGESVLAYAPSAGIEVLLEAVRDYYGALNISLALEDMLVTTGGSEALEVTMSCILDEGAEVLVPEPFYPNYSTFINITGGRIRPIPTSPEEGYRFASRERIEPLIGPNTRAILVTNPGNPTGTVLTDEEKRVLVDIAKEHNLFLISDEVYREIIYSDRPLSSMLEYADAAENIVVIDSVSKRFSSCGARVGVMVSRNRELMSHALKICQGRLCSATLDQIGAAALYRTMTPEYCASVRDEYRRRRDVVVAGLEKLPGVRFSSPEGAFYLMVTLPVDDADALQYFLLKDFHDNNETVMYAPGEGFYATPGKGRNEIRIAYVTNPGDLTRAIELLGLGIEAYNRSK
ncbi:MAG: pyridoxal phosphate-dependent aminotransferase [Oscillibacter sp.]|nr:pyridoxal phosphate-dependent aminotransferase [Oscillibacter sp.]